MTSMSKGPHAAAPGALPPFQSAISEQPASNGLPRPVIIGSVLAVLVVVGSIVAFRPKAPPPNAPGAMPPVLTVTAATPRRMMWSETVEVSGAIVPWQEAIIAAQITGPQITEVLAEVGDQVKKGQVLARLDKALLRADEAVLLATFEQADANHKRALSLREKGFISEQNILSLETQMRTSRAQLDAKRVQLRYADVVAPDDGVVSARTATLGAVATNQELFRLIRQNRLEWRGELPAKHLQAVKIGQEVTLALPSGGMAKAIVRQNAPALTADARLGVVYADVAPGSEARAGMYATGRINVGAHEALVIPAEAVVLRDGRSFALELEGNDANAGKVIFRGVETGRRDGNDVEIMSGLSDTARVAVRGSGFLNDGDHVRIVGAPKPGG